MELYLVRHGQAEARGDAWPDDRLRPLTSSGIRQFRKAAKGLRRAGVHLDVILTSPLTRSPARFA